MTRPLELRYGVALAASAVALLGSLAVGPLLEGSPALLFLAAVIFSAAYGGFGPGLLPTAIGSLAVVYVPEAWGPSQSVAGLSTLLGVFLFVLVAVLDTVLNTRLRDARQRAEVERAAAIQRSARLRALQDAALTIATPVPAEPAAIAALLARIMEGAVAAVGGKDASFVLAEDDAWRHLVPESVSAEGAIRLDHRGRPSRVALRRDGATVHVLKNGEFVAVPDTLAVSRFGPYPQLAQRGVRSFAIVPLRAGGRVLGSLSVNYAHRAALQEEDREALELFASHAAAALERVRLVHAERRRAHEVATQAEALARQDAEAAALRELDRLKNEFLRMVVHELRTPLTVVHGYAEMLKLRADAPQPAKVKLAAEQILAGAAQLARLVDDLLDFTRIESGEVAVHPVDFDLVPILHDLLEGFRLEARGERLVADLPERLLVHADQARVAQVVSNLLDNALKYAPEGKIVLRARSADGASSGPSGTGSVRVEVEDQGPGIAQEEQPRVWERLFRGRAVSELNITRGSGIGLAVVKALVEAHGGGVGLDSTPGLGARFWFELPAAATPHTLRGSSHHACQSSAVCSLP